VKQNVGSVIVYEGKGNYYWNYFDI
jgi:hypothetical protein